MIFYSPQITTTLYTRPNLGTLDVKLTKDEEGEIRKLVDAAEVHGDRYPSATIRALFGDTPALKA